MLYLQNLRLPNFELSMPNFCIFLNLGKFEIGQKFWAFWKFFSQAQGLKQLMQI